MRTDQRRGASHQRLLQEGHLQEKGKRKKIFSWLTMRGHFGGAETLEMENILGFLRSFDSFLRHFCVIGYGLHIFQRARKSSFFTNSYTYNPSALSISVVLISYCPLERFCHFSDFDPFGAFCEYRPGIDSTFPE